MKPTSAKEEALFAAPPPTRQIFCNRTLNLRAIQAVGFDMDYTLIHYRIEAWEERAYEHVRQKLILNRGWPLESSRFKADVGGRGLVIDTEAGNIVKADRFGYVKQARHGTSMVPFEEQRHLYSQELIDLRDGRWKFMNTLFALSEASLYAQCVDLLDSGKITEPLGYVGLYRAIRAAVDQAHMMGLLKAEVVADPELFIEPDPKLPGTLLDLREAGKKLLLITNSEWAYTRDVMAMAVNPYLPSGVRSWRELFDLIIVSAGKPRFFLHRNPIFEIVDDEAGLLRPVMGKLRDGGIYLGGDASRVEEHLGLSGSELLYVGDHIYADVNVTKSLLRWRTALIVRELEAEVEARERFRPTQAKIAKLMARKVELERGKAHLRLELQRIEHGRKSGWSAREIRGRLGGLREKLTALDNEIGPLAKTATELGASQWGPTMRAGNDKSHLARQIERYADVYTSRVSNFGLTSPYAYLRAPRSSLPHDADTTGGCHE